MSTNLVSFSFEENNVRTVVVDDTPYWVGKDVCLVLGYADTINAIKLHCKGVAKYHPIVDTLGRPQEARIISEPDLLRLIIGSRLPAAEKFERWVFEEVLPTIRKTGSYGVSPDLEARLEIAEAKLQIFEEHCPAKFYDLDEVAALMHFYVKPPFGRNHLKRWLIDRKILCTQAFKNDKPIQSYIDRGWFVAVIHEWFRRGKKHSENRFYMTPRGVMGVIDMAIREKLLTLPAPKQACLPGLYRGA